MAKKNQIRLRRARKSFRKNTFGGRRKHNLRFGSDISSIRGTFNLTINNKQVDVKTLRANSEYDSNTFLIEYASSPFDEGDRLNDNNQTKFYTTYNFDLNDFRGKVIELVNNTSLTSQLKKKDLLNLMKQFLHKWSETNFSKLEKNKIVSMLKEILSSTSTNLTIPNASGLSVNTSASPQNSPLSSPTTNASGTDTEDENITPSSPTTNANGNTNITENTSTTSSPQNSPPSSPTTTNLTINTNVSTTSSPQNSPTTNASMFTLPSPSYNPSATVPYSIPSPDTLQDFKNKILRLNPGEDLSLINDFQKAGTKLRELAEEKTNIVKVIKGNQKLYEVTNVDGTPAEWGVENLNSLNVKELRKLKTNVENKIVSLNTAYENAVNALTPVTTTNTGAQRLLDLVKELADAKKSKENLKKLIDVVKTGVDVETEKIAGATNKLYELIKDEVNKILLSTPAVTVDLSNVVEVLKRAIEKVRGTASSKRALSSLINELISALNTNPVGSSVTGVAPTTLHEAVEQYEIRVNAATSAAAVAAAAAITAKRTEVTNKKSALSQLVGTVKNVNVGVSNINVQNVNTIADTELDGVLTALDAETTKANNSINTLKTYINAKINVIPTLTAFDPTKPDDTNTLKQLNDIKKLIDEAVTKLSGKTYDATTNLTALQSLATSVENANTKIGTITGLPTLIFSNVALDYINQVNNIITKLTGYPSNVNYPTETDVTNFVTKVIDVKRKSSIFSTNNITHPDGTTVSADDYISKAGEVTILLDSLSQTNNGYADITLTRPSTAVSFDDFKNVVDKIITKVNKLKTYVVPGAIGTTSLTINELGRQSGILRLIESSIAAHNKLVSKGGATYTVTLTALSSPPSETIDQLETRINSEISKQEEAYKNLVAAQGGIVTMNLELTQISMKYKNLMGIVADPTTGDFDYTQFLATLKSSHEARTRIYKLTQNFVDEIDNFLERFYARSGTNVSIEVDTGDFKKPGAVKNELEPWLAYEAIKNGIIGTRTVQFGARATVGVPSVVKFTNLENFIKRNRANQLYYDIIRTKVLTIVSLTSIIFTYLLVPGTPAVDKFIVECINHRGAVAHEVIISGRELPFVTFMNPDDAYQFERLISNSKAGMYWVDLVIRLNPGTKLFKNPGFYFKKFTTPHILSKFFSYYDNISGEYEDSGSVLNDENVVTGFFKWFFRFGK